MEEIIEKAFDSANYAATFSSQKQILKEEFNQNLIYFHAGGIFTITRDLICFIKTLKDMTSSNTTVIVDDNQTPIEIKDLSSFLEEVISKYNFAVNGYYTRYNAIRMARNVKTILEK